MKLTVQLQLHRKVWSPGAHFSHCIHHVVMRDVFTCLPKIITLHISFSWFIGLIATGFKKGTYLFMGDMGGDPVARRSACLWWLFCSAHTHHNIEFRTLSWHNFYLLIVPQQGWEKIILVAGESRMSSKNNLKKKEVCFLVNMSCSTFFPWIFKSSYGWWISLIPPCGYKFWYNSILKFVRVA